jgi:hypothetical protein
MSFGLLTANDDQPEEREGGQAVVTVGRASYALGGSNAAGALVTERRQAGRRNTVVGSDVSIRTGEAHQWLGSVLVSGTTDSSSSRRGMAGHGSYEYQTRRLALSAQVEHYSPDFDMATAFYYRTGFTTGTASGGINFYPKEGSDFWIKRVHPYAVLSLGRDRIQRGAERNHTTGVNVSFTRQGFLAVSHSRGEEPWKGRQFDTGGGLDVYGVIQLVSWLGMNGSYSSGRRIFYDDTDPFQGRSRDASVGLVLQPSPRLSHAVDYSAVRFRRAATGDRVFDVDIVNLRTTYQFDRRFLVRVLEQYDSSRRQLLTDLLASYEFVPGTVFHAGYGSLHERLDADGTSDRDESRYLTTRRGVFFKASYLHRF